jgi:glycosyltransferase involved in cell wall biosynthesis
VKVVMLVMNDMRADSRVTREASALAAAGHRVTVLALRSPGVPESEERLGFSIRRVAEYTTASLRRPLDKIRQSRTRTAAMVTAAAALQPDIVHAHDSDTLPAGGRAARAACARLVYDAHELYPDMLQEHGFQGSWPVQRYWLHTERTWVPAAAAVITVSPGLAEELRRRHGVRASVVSNVPPLTPASRSERLRRELGLAPAEPILLYQGVLIAGRGLEQLVRSMREVPDAVLAVQGFGAAEAQMRKAAHEAGVKDRVRFMGRVAPDQLHEYACGADAGIVIYEHTTLNNYLSAPNKLFSYLMAGLPVAASDFPGLRAIVEGEAVGVTFDPASETSIAKALLRLLGDEHVSGAMGRRARALAESRYNWNVEQRVLLGVYERLAASSTC